MKKSGQPSMKALFIPLLLFSLYTSAQAVIAIDGVRCDVHGSAKAGSRAYYINALKNRYTFPRSTDFDKSITFPALIQSADPNQFSTDKAVRLQGYVFNVKVGGVESCNCKTKDPAFRDTHIELTPDETHTGPQYRLIAEVTPRLRAMMANKGQDWSTDGLREKLKGHYVAITGWLLYDAEHESGAAANDPNDAIGAQNWRATCWEIHPITAINRLSAGEIIANDTTKQEQPAPDQPSQNPQGTSGNGFFIILVIAVILLLILIYSRSRKKT